MIPQEELDWAIPNIPEKVLIRATRVFIKGGTTFAVYQGVLYMSAASVELFQQKHKHIWYGHLDI